MGTKLQWNPLFSERNENHSIASHHVTLLAAVKSKLSQQKKTYLLKSHKHVTSYKWTSLRAIKVLTQVEIAVFHANSNSLSSLINTTNSLLLKYRTPGRKIECDRTTRTPPNCTNLKANFSVAASRDVLSAWDENFKAVRNAYDVCLKLLLMEFDNFTCSFEIWHQKVCVKLALNIEYSEEIGIN